jgi:hypothetical protein
MAHELAREKDRKILKIKLQELELEKQQDFDREMKKMKEILG